MGGEIAFVIVFGLAVAGVALAYALKHQQKADEAWQEAAAALGMRCGQRGLFKKRTIKGHHEGIRVLVDTYTQSHGKSSTTYTRYRVSYPPLGLGLHLKRQGALAGLARFVGFQDIDVGDAVFDEAVVVKGDIPRKVVEFLTPVRRMKIQRLLRGRPGSEIRDSQIRYRKRGLETDASKITSNVLYLCQVAQVLCAEPDPEAPMERALLAQREARLDEALEVIEPMTAAERTDADPDAQVLRGEILYTAGEYEQAAEILEEVLEERPEDAELQALAEHSAARARPPAPPAPPADPAPPPPPPPEVEVLEDAAAICEDLFGGSRMSFESAKLFEQRYEGRLVRWSGRLHDVGTYSFDRIFGRGPGTKATVDLHEVGAESYSHLLVRAVVQLPEEARETLQGSRHETIAFRGRLLRCDAFVRNLFVGEGELID